MPDNTQTTPIPFPSEPQRPPWDPMEKESAMWYARFLVFRNLLPTQRTMEECYRQCKAVEPQLDGEHPNVTWYRAKQNFRWEQRAMAWDVFQSRRAFMEREQTRILRMQADQAAADEARTKRRSVMLLLLDKIYEIFQGTAPGSVDFAVAVDALERIAKLQRTDYGDDQLTGAGFASLNDVDAAIESQLRALLHGDGPAALDESGIDALLAQMMQK